jgi:hypothetical protein
VQHVDVNSLKLWCMLNMIKCFCVIVSVFGNEPSRPLCGATLFSVGVIMLRFWFLFVVGVLC